MIVFVGVNGVGKSTNLAKIAYWLVQNKMKVLLEHECKIDVGRSPPAFKMMSNLHDSV